MAGVKSDPCGATGAAGGDGDGGATTGASGAGGCGGSLAGADKCVSSPTSLVPSSASLAGAL